QKFELQSNKVIDEYKEAQEAGIATKPVILGPISFLLLGKEKEEGFNRLDLIDVVLPVYKEAIAALKEAGAKYIQLDEPCLVLDLTNRERTLYTEVYEELHRTFPELHFILAGYFGDYGDNLETVINL